MGNYRLGRVLGQGAFAQVHESRDRHGHPVAVKLLTSSHEQARKRFDREIKVVRSLPANPHVVSYRDHGLSEEGHAYLVMELVEGKTLSYLLSAGVRPDVRGACRLMVQLCEAFDGLHRLGLTHGDIKPSNILITNDGRSTKLIDFGLVRDSQGLLKLLEEERILDGDDFADDLDQGMLMGTPVYLAPEQIDDADRDSLDRVTDTPADVWGLGAIFYELLSGSPPIPMVVKPEQVAVEAALEYVSLREQWSDLQLRPIPGLSPQLWTILTKALRKDPSLRQGEARYLKQDIQRFLDLGIGVPPEQDARTATAIEITALQSLLVEACTGLREDDNRGKERSALAMNEPQLAQLQDSFALGGNEDPMARLWPYVLGGALICWGAVLGTLWWLGWLPF